MTKMLTEMTTIRMFCSRVILLMMMMLRTRIENINVLTNSGRVMEMRYGGSYE